MYARHTLYIFEKVYMHELCLLYLPSYKYEHVVIFTSILPFVNILDIGGTFSKQKHSVSTGVMTEFAEASQTTNRNGWFSRSIPLQMNAMVAINRGEYRTVTLLSQCCSITSTIPIQKSFICKRSNCMKIY
jgi:hypothetical protein